MTAIEFFIDLKGAQLAAKLMGVAPLLAEEMHEAMADIESSLGNDTVSRMHWKDPSGALEESIYEDSSSTTWSAMIGSGLPYTRRRDWGFDGTDSLGRTYHDVGAEFLDDTLDEKRDYVNQRIKDAVARTFFGIAASL